MTSRRTYLCGLDPERIASVLSALREPPVRREPPASARPPLAAAPAVVAAPPPPAPSTVATPPPPVPPAATRSAATEAPPEATRRSLDAVPFDPTQVAPGARFDAFFDWAGALLGFETAFILDAQGLELKARGANENVAALASAMNGLMLRLQDCLETPLGKTVAVDLGQDGTLQFTELDLGWSRFTFGFVPRSPVPYELLALVRQRLAEVFELEVSGELPTVPGGDATGPITGEDAE